jgi:hypothetical protein
VIRLFTGWDAREAIGWHAFAQSVIENASVPVAITPLSYDSQLDGSNAFTYSRFLVPELCNWSGMAVFADGADMLMLGDIAELWAMRSDKLAVQVVKHEYKTRHPRKYVGTEMESANTDYPRKNWSSLVIWNCAHISHFNARTQIRDAMERGDGAYLHRFGWLKDEQIGELPEVWNHLVGEGGDDPKAKLLHYTAGIPSIPAYQKMSRASAWYEAHSRATTSPTVARILEVASAR